MSNNYSCFLISNKPHLYNEVVKNLRTENVNFFDGSNVSSFSQLVNTCVESAPTEIVILMSDKMRPNDHNIQKTLNLLKKGFAFVGLYRFGFFGFKKELFRQIGPMDERYKGGGYEDDDFYIRLCESNLAMYLSHEVDYIKSKSSWASEICKQHFYKKWGDVKGTGIAKRNLPELSHNYSFGNNIESDFLNWNFTEIHAKKVKRYQNLRILK